MVNTGVIAVAIQRHAEAVEKLAAAYLQVHRPVDAAPAPRPAQRDGGARRYERDLVNLLGEIYLYVDWRYVTKQLTTAQQERWADAIEAWSALLNADGHEPPLTVPRWWRERKEAE